MFTGAILRHISLMMDVYKIYFLPSADEPNHSNLLWSQVLPSTVGKTKLVWTFWNISEVFPLLKAGCNLTSWPSSQGHAAADVN